MRTGIRRLSSVETLPDYCLKLTLQDGGEAAVDMTGTIFKLDYLAALRDEAAFRDVQVIDYGTGIEWENGIDYSADSLEMLAANRQR